MVDCVGNKLFIGDKVVCSDAIYADLLIGEIIGFTPRKAKIRYVRSGENNQILREQNKESYQIFKYSACDKDCCNCGNEIDGKCPFEDVCITTTDNKVPSHWKMR